jgi:hypothetical protein
MTGTHHSSVKTGAQIGPHLTRFLTWFFAYRPAQMPKFNEFVLSVSCHSSHPVRDAIAVKHIDLIDTLDWAATRAGHLFTVT